MTIPRTGAGGYNWLDVWTRMYDDERQQAEAALLSTDAQRADYWAKQSARFAATARRVPQPDSFMRFLLPRLRPTDTLLDIGAGTGRYEPTLARAVASVIAVEPSPSMRTQLEERVAEEQLTNVELIGANWPDAQVPACDVVVSAHVLYGVRDLEPFLRKMDASAHRACFLLLALRHPTAFVNAFWQHFHGEPRYSLPGALECVNALHQIGIMAHLSLVPLSQPFYYVNEQEAVADLRGRLRLPEQVSDAELHDAIASLLDRDQQGHLWVREQPTRAAVLWWTHEEE